MAYFDCIVGGSGKGNTLVVTCADELAGATITCTNGTKTYTKTCPSTAPYEVTFYGLMAGSWTVSATVSGNTYTTTVVVVDCAALLGGFNWRTWVDTAQYLDSSDYNSLDEVLADELAVRELCLEHACVDYLAAVPSVNADIETVINNDLFAKWVNNSDYSLDILGANAVIKALMDEADKYGYGEWVIVDDTTTPPTWGAKGNVPVMTANNAPYGTAIYSDVYGSGVEAYRAFDDDPSTYWSPADGTADDFIGYKSVNPICVRRWHYYTADSLANIKARTSSLKLMGSNDNSTWDLIDEVATSEMTSNTIDRAVVNDNYYIYHKVVLIKSSSSGIGCNTLQFYGRELKVSVPIMTANNAPYGEAFASDVYSSSYPAWYAFDTYTGSSDGNYWASAQSDGLKYIGYKFPSKVRAKYIFTFGLMDNSGSNPKLEGSNDGNTWTQIAEIPELKVAGSKTVTILDDNIADYQYFRISGNRASGYLYMYEFRIYGFDYSEKEFESGTTKKWLYDHGVELEELTIRTFAGSGGSVNKEESKIAMIAPSGTVYGVVTANGIDLTDHNIARAKIGEHFSNGNGRFIVDDVAAIPWSASSWTGYKSYSPGDASLPNNLSLDLSSVSGNQYLAFADEQVSSTAYIDLVEMWLE